jgi:hypothetical protein
MNILVKLPTRSRPEKAIAVLNEYRRLESGKHDVLYTVITDDDDPTNTLPREQADNATTWVTGGRSISKIHACNRNTFETSWDILVLISDDQWPVAQGWDDIIASHMPEHLDACLHFNDGNRGKELNTLPIMGRKRYDKFGYIYHPSYVSLWADNEYTEVHKPIYIDQVIIEHRHPAYHSNVKADALLNATESWNEVDRMNYLNRAWEKFPTTFPKLTIAICTIPGREMDLTRLQYGLAPQIHSDVQLLIHRSAAITTGAKRQELLNRALGEYVCFIDDDDLVAHNYVDRILTALHKNPLTDAVGFTGEMTTSGINPEHMFHHWYKGKPEWSTEADPIRKGSNYYIRGPTHLNPIRTCLARRTGFKDITLAEDFDYAQRVHPLIRHGVNLDDPPLYYYLFQHKKVARISPKSPNFKKGKR